LTWRIYDVLTTYIPSASNASGAGGGIGFITTNTTFYVRTDGNDTNAGTGNSAAGAFRTIQKAINYISAFSVANGTTVTIQLGDGTYAENVRLLVVAGGGAVVINGNAASPGNVILAPTTGDALTGNQPICNWLIQNFTITAVNGICIAASLGATVVVGNGMVFGVAKSGQYHMLANNNSCIIISGNYSVTGGTGNHLYATRGSAINNSQSFSIAISNSPTFTAFTAADDNGVVAIFGMTFSGTTVGKKFDINLNGVVHTLGAGVNYFPGTTPGTTANGGQYQ
jgi:hypothetical protein